MKFRWASFENFRLLRKVTIDFSLDPEKPLTVIRAENESGKTTVLTGLQWALFDEEGLPGGGKDYRLHPIDWDSEASPRVPIKVELEFEHTYQRRNPDGEWIESTEVYRLQRTSTERISGPTSWNRSSSSLTLLRLTGKGATPIERPAPFLQEILPKELREVFFTDGDRALSFIEADIGGAAAKRRRVEAALRALLGLGVVEDAETHVKQASADMNKKVRNVQGAQELAETSAGLEETRSDLAAEEAKLKQATQELATIETYLLDVERDLETALRKGDKEQLARELEQARRSIADLEAREKGLGQRHSELFKDPAVFLGLVTEQLAKAASGLDVLKEKGTIPSNAIPVLEERLALKLCICGTALGEGTHERQCVVDLVEEQRQADDLRDRLTDLFYRARPYVETPSSNEADWVSRYKTVARDRTDAERQLTELRGKVRELDLQLAAIGDTDISTLRKRRSELTDQRDRLARDQAMAQARIDLLKKQEGELNRKQETLLRSKARYARMLSELEATADILTVLERTHRTIMSEELTKVSDTMNALFLRMIGADHEQSAIIRKAELTPEFDIVVHGPVGRQLDPDRDLNGASRRALTLSFILALTQVSGVAAPNVVDTPLGMMAGFVKRSVLETAIENSSQLVLLLTRSEIAGCSDVLDKRAGAVLTLTNTAHYPRMLVNDPDVPERMAMRCDCSHTQICLLCERVGDAESGELELRTG